MTSIRKIKRRVRPNLVATHMNRRRRILAAQQNTVRVGNYAFFAIDKYGRQIPMTAEPQEGASP